MGENHTILLNSPQGPCDLMLVKRNIIIARVVGQPMTEVAGEMEQATTVVSDSVVRGRCGIVLIIPQVMSST